MTLSGRDQLSFDLFFSRVVRKPIHGIIVGAVSIYIDGILGHLFYLTTVHRLDLISHKIMVLFLL